MIAEDLIVMDGGWNGNQSMDSIEVFKFNKEKATLEIVEVDENIVKLADVRNKPCSVVLWIKEYKYY